MQSGAVTLIGTGSCAVLRMGLKRAAKLGKNREGPSVAGKRGEERPTHHEHEGGRTKMPSPAHDWLLGFKYSLVGSNRGKE